MNTLIRTAREAKTHGLTVYKYCSFELKKRPTPICQVCQQEFEYYILIWLYPTEPNIRVEIFCPPCLREVMDII